MSKPKGNKSFKYPKNLWLTFTGDGEIYSENFTRAAARNIAASSYDLKVVKYIRAPKQ